MFDPKKYWKNRKAHKRGQVVPKEVFYAKGETIEYVTREGKKAEYPNALGAHYIQVGTRLTPANRKQARAAGDFYRKPEERKPEKPDPRLSNRQRFDIRKAQREAQRATK